MQYKKLTNTQMETTETKQVSRVYSIVDLENDNAIYQKQIDGFQEKIDKNLALLSEMTKLGIVNPEPAGEVDDTIGSIAVPV